MRWLNLSLDSLSRILLDTPNIDISTSAPTENQLIEFFYQLIKEDVQEVLFICLSSSLSQTYKNLLNISSMFSHRMKIYIYDSRTISHGEAVLVQEASRLLKKAQKSLKSSPKSTACAIKSISIWPLITLKA